MTLTDTLNGALRKAPTWPLYVLAVAPPAWLFWLGLTGGLGVEPINALERELGLLGLQVLLASLAVTPLRRITGLNLIRFRRAIGLIGFFYIVLHLTAWAVLDVQSFGRVWADIVKRPYITVGMAGLLLLVPLAVTSNNLSIRKMGAASWRRLHKLVYPAIVLGVVHFVMQAKGWQLEPLVYLGAILALLALRLKAPRKLLPARAG